MLAAHWVPGYFAAALSQPKWRPEWSPLRRTILWIAAMGSAVAPDLDAIYNTLFHGSVYHSTLWTHSVFPHAVVALGWLLLAGYGRWPYLQALVGLMAVGGWSHLLLDVVSHGTPLLFPLSFLMFGAPSLRVLEGGVLAYVTDPIFLVEPLLLGLAAAHFVTCRCATGAAKRLATVVFVFGIATFTAGFLLSLPALQALVAAWPGS